tara:strand:+ start:62 stop:442 length:381 start_codon:yes stop_codon:yes gene_type:complete
MIKDTNVYLKDIMRKILNSYSIIDELSDQPDDLQLLKIELQKINGFLLVLSKKLYLINIDHSTIKKLEDKIILYFKNYDFSREINLLIDTYANDNLRVKNIRMSIINSLNDGKLMESIYEKYNSFS